MANSVESVIRSAVGKGIVVCPDDVVSQPAIQAVAAVTGIADLEDRVVALAAEQGVGPGPP